MNFDVYIFVTICHVFSHNFLSFLCSVLCVRLSPIRVAETYRVATETATLNHGCTSPYRYYMDHHEQDIRPQGSITGRDILNNLADIGPPY